MTCIAGLGRIKVKRFPTWTLILELFASAQAFIFAGGAFGLQETVVVFSRQKLEKDEHSCSEIEFFVGPKGSTDHGFHKMEQHCRCEKGTNGIMIN